MTSPGRCPKVLIAGIAPGMGAGLASAFSGNGYDVLGLSRSAGFARSIGDAVRNNRQTFVHIACDLTVPAQVGKALAPHAHEIDVVVYNAHALLIEPFERIAARDFEHLWRVACLGAMTVAQAVLPAMDRRGGGVLIFTGATASLRGNPGFSAFASAKFALRGLAQSLAREFGPKGIHVCHVVLDGLIDEPQTADRFGLAAPGRDDRMDPLALANAYFALAQQPRSAWTHEIDLRPYSEDF